MTTGFGVNIGEHFEANFAYYHAFANIISGPFVSPAVGNIPQSRVTNELSEDAVILQVSYKH